MRRVNVFSNQKWLTNAVAGTQMYCWCVRRRQFWFSFLSIVGVVALVYCLHNVERTDVKRLRLVSAKSASHHRSFVAQSTDRQNASKTLQLHLNFNFEQSVNRVIQPPMSETFNCAKLFKGDVIETARALTFRKTSSYKSPLYSDFLQSTSNCAIFRRARGYMSNATAEEKSFPLAFSILVHKSVDQFERLLRAIYRPHNYYCVHVDKKSTSAIHKTVQSIVKCFDNVFMASKAEVVVYAGYTRLQADINCMEDLIHCCKDWKYVLNMAGTEFPLRPNQHMVQILQMFEGSNVIERHQQTISPWQYENKFITWTDGVSKGKLYKVSDVNDPPPFNLKVTKCSAYGAFSKEFIEFVLYNTKAQAFLNWSKSTYSPDELFWGTLNNLHDNHQLATPGGDCTDEDNHLTRAVLWKSRECHGKNVHTICNFGAGDLPWLKGGYQLIANKFDLTVDQIAYNCMEELLVQRQEQKYPSKIKTFKTYIRKLKKM